MDLHSPDERDVLLPLYLGLLEERPWRTFLSRLQARTGARQVTMLVDRPGGGRAAPVEWTVLRDPSDRPTGWEALAEAGFFPRATMRPMRAYALQEMFDSAQLKRDKAESLAALNVADARMIRVTSRNEHQAWIMLLDDRGSLGAADSALLGAVAPHLAVALALQAALDDGRLRGVIARQALERLGIGLVVLDGGGAVVTADDRAAALLAAPGGVRGELAAGQRRLLEEQCARLVADPSAGPVLGRLGGADVLLRGIVDGPPGLVTGTLRQAPSGAGPGAANILRTTYGLSRREAALAIAICEGHSIAEAGTALGLSMETARNYSKRIYAKMGARGQADLVRLVLTGLAPLA